MMSNWTRFFTVCVGLLLVASVVAAQQIFEWEDEKGGRHYSHVPPVGSAGDVAVHSANTPVPRANDAPSAPRDESNDDEDEEDDGSNANQAGGKAANNDNGDDDEDEAVDEGDDDEDETDVYIEDDEDEDGGTKGKARRQQRREERRDEGADVGEPETVIIDDGRDRESQFEHRRTDFESRGQRSGNYNRSRK